MQAVLQVPYVYTHYTHSILISNFSMFMLDKSRKLANSPFQTRNPWTCP